VGWTISVDRETCIGSGNCVVYAPGTFGQDEAAKAFVLAGASDGIDTVRLAVEACPTRSLRLINDEEG
jgi:ferredoxin